MPGYRGMTRHRSRLLSRATSRPPVFETLEQRQLLATTWQYDFGATGSPVAAGYVPVATAAYSAAAGYGWTSGQVDTRDRGALPGTSALTEDFVTTAAATFAVAVPNGTYSVTVTLGDAAYAHGPMGVSLQGQQVDSLATAAGQFAARTYTAVVSGGQLVLGLKSLSANPSDQVTIDALAIIASGTSPSPPAPSAFQQYDFGPSGSPVAAGYVPVATAAYSAAAGYGWTSGQVDTRDRGALPGTSALTEDFVTTAAATFAVAVPNGTYSVTVTLGDAAYAHGPMGVSLQGQQVDSLATAAGQFAGRTYTAVVSGGQLVLGLKSLSANPSDQVTIDALSIAAAGSAPTPPASPPPASPAPPPPPPPLTPGPHVTTSTPTGNTSGPVSQITLTFSEPIQGGSFTLADIDSLIGPAGPIIPLAANAVDSAHYTIVFPAQSAPGTYLLTVGPNILDMSGNAMDQNRDGINGAVPQDEYVTSFVLTNTTVPKAGIVSVVAENIGNANLANSPVRFAEVFADGDVPAGSRLVLSLPDGTSVPYTAARVNTWPDGSLRTADILAELPSGASGTTTITPGNTLPLTFTAQPGAFNNALPAGKTVADIVSEIVNGTAPIGVELDGLTNSAGLTVGSGTWVADSATAFGLTGTAGGYTCVATGPTVADFEARMMLRDPNRGNAQNANLWVEFYITAFLNPSTGAVQELSWRTWLDQGNMAAINDSFQAKVKLTLGGNIVRSWGFASDGRDMTFAPSAVNTANSQITLPGNGFVNGEVVQFSSTARCPAASCPTRTTGCARSGPTRSRSTTISFRPA